MKNSKTEETWIIELQDLFAEATCTAHKIRYIHNLITAEITAREENERKTERTLIIYIITQQFGSHKSSFEESLKNLWCVIKIRPK